MPTFLRLTTITALGITLCACARENHGRAPALTGLKTSDVSYEAEKKLPYLETPFITATPDDLRDGIPVGELGTDGGQAEVVLKFAQEVADGKHGPIDSLLLFQNNKLLFESYYRRGRVNYPHYQMSITKSYTAMAVGRAIQLGHLSMDDLDQPVVSFLDQLDRSKLVAGADSITLAEAMNMRSGIRFDRLGLHKRMKGTDALKGQGQVQTYLQHSAPIPKASRQFNYQSADPCLVMQVLEASVPGSARRFIEKELLRRMGIRNFAWQDDVSGLPKSAAGSSMRSRDMIKWGMLTMSGGQWNGKQLIPQEFVTKAVSRLHTNPQGTSYGFFWWRENMVAGGRKIDCISGRGAGGQFILMFPELKLIAVITAHNKGMGNSLKTFPKHVLPAFLDN